ncbi:copper radical oxidase [Myriangium duriaei CBS 260.36]|uniref:Copper radical oxidase n=1 Tax=Myriangium duriaei CBS 260.36 TaxID=1168546 RepID=A0A9P4MSF4_9PEZI|nr:copper radical oxidase [Myriangium duriaei CBS 260.36]
MVQLPRVPRRPKSGIPSTNIALWLNTKDLEHTVHGLPCGCWMPHSIAPSAGPVVSSHLFSRTHVRHQGCSALHCPPQLPCQDESMTQGPRTARLLMGLDASGRVGSLVAAFVVRPVVEIYPLEAAAMRYLPVVLASCLGTAHGANLGKWGPTIRFPLVPAAAAVNPDGKLLVWSAYSAITQDIGVSGMTQTAQYDPATDKVTQYTVSNTHHDMFCPGISLDFNGKLVVTGGDTANATSLHDAAKGDWYAGGLLKIARGYQSSATVSDGRVFTIGGSWSGPLGGKIGEIYASATNAWSLLSGCPVTPMLTNDADGIYRQDNHAWLFAWKNGHVLQAGPSKNMNWYGTSGNGSQTPAGTRGKDGDAMCGVAVMYDAVAGKIFSAGGSPSYENISATTNAQVITITEPNTKATTVDFNPMWYARSFANGVLLPDGQVFIVGGQTYPVPFSDANATLTPEMWNPVTTKFTKLATGPTPRTYHSVALLMPNGTVFSGGGGLCDDCSTNHLDGQIFTPPYLYNSDGVTLAQRPVISSVSSKTPKVGSRFSISLQTVPSSSPSFSLVRLGSATHTVDTDQRRIALANYIKTYQNSYDVQLPNDTGVLLPGYYYVFALVGGVPSVATIVRVTT